MVGSIKDDSLRSRLLFNSCCHKLTSELVPVLSALPNRYLHRYFRVGLISNVGKFIGTIISNSTFENYFISTFDVCFSESFTHLSTAHHVSNYYKTFERYVVESICCLFYFVIFTNHTWKTNTTQFLLIMWRFREDKRHETTNFEKKKRTRAG